MPSALNVANYLPESMVVLYDSTLSADAASFDVQNIPQGYKHLCVVLQCRSSKAAVNEDNFALRVNNDTGNNYNVQYLQAFGTTANAQEALATADFYKASPLCSLATMPAATSPSGASSSIIIDIPNYASTALNKNVVAQASQQLYNTSQGQRIWNGAGTWLNTAAINRLTFLAAGGNLVAGSRLTIYGLGGAQLSEITGIDGWTSDPSTWTYASSTTFTVTGDKTAKFSKGTRIKLSQTTVKYFVVTGSSHSTGTTTVTITGGSDYSLANATITDPFYSYQANPQGYPSYFNWTPVFLSDNADHTLGNGTITGTFSILGDEATVSVIQTWGSTTVNGTGKYYLQAVPAGSYPAEGPLGSTDMFDSSATAWYVGHCHAMSSRICGQTAGGTTQWRNDTPTTWATSDVYRMNFKYRV